MIYQSPYVLSFQVSISKVSAKGKISASSNLPLDLAFPIWKCCLVNFQVVLQETNIRMAGLLLSGATIKVGPGAFKVPDISS